MSVYKQQDSFLLTVWFYDLTEIGHWCNWMTFKKKNEMNKGWWEIHFQQKCSCDNVRIFSFLYLLHPHLMLPEFFIIFFFHTVYKIVKHHNTKRGVSKICLQSTFFLFSLSSPPTNYKWEGKEKKMLNICTKNILLLFPFSIKVYITIVFYASFHSTFIVPFLPLLS